MQRRSGGRGRSPSPASAGARHGAHSSDPLAHELPGPSSPGGRGSQSGTLPPEGPLAPVTETAEQESSSSPGGASRECSSSHSSLQDDPPATATPHPASPAEPPLQQQADTSPHTVTRALASSADAPSYQQIEPAVPQLRMQADVPPGGSPGIVGPAARPSHNQPALAPLNIMASGEGGADMRPLQIGLASPALVPVNVTSPTVRAPMLATDPVAGTGQHNLGPDERGHSSQDSVPSTPWGADRLRITPSSQSMQGSREMPAEPADPPAASEPAGASHGSRSGPGVDPTPSAVAQPASGVQGLAAAGDSVVPPVPPLLGTTASLPQDAAASQESFPTQALDPAKSAGPAATQSKLPK